MCDLKSNLSLLKEVEASEEEGLDGVNKEENRMNKLQEATERRQFNFQKKVDVKRLERHGSIMTNVLSEAEFVRKQAQGGFAGFGSPFGQVRKKEREREREKKETVWRKQ